MGDDFYDNEEIENIAKLIKSSFDWWYRRNVSRDSDKSYSTSYDAYYPLNTGVVNSYLDFLKTEYDIIAIYNFKIRSFVVFAYDEEKATMFKLVAGASYNA